LKRRFEKTLQHTAENETDARRNLAEKLLANKHRVRYVEDLAREYKQQKLERNYYARVLQASR
jgi:hypothetical protein